MTFRSFVDKLVPAPNDTISGRYTITMIGSDS